MVEAASKLTLVLLASLLGWRDPTPPDFWSSLGEPESRVFVAALRESMRAHDTGDVNGAERAAARAVALMPDRFEGHLLLGLAQEGLLRDEAAASFARALALEARWARDPVAADYASSAFARVRDFAGASAIACDAARSAEPSLVRAELFERCAAARLALGPASLDEARRFLDLAEYERPTPRFLILLALAYDRSGEHARALVTVRPIAQRALDEHIADELVGHPSDVLAANGLLFEALNRMREAVTAYEAAAAEGPWREHARAAASRAAVPVARPSSVTSPARPAPRRR